VRVPAPVWYRRHDDVDDMQVLTRRTVEEMEDGVGRRGRRI
jgi:hypothetical protein